MRHTAIIIAFANHEVEIDTFVMELTARTEQVSMTGRSVEALIKR